jgi:hypothetical protein
MESNSGIPGYTVASQHLVQCSLSSVVRPLRWPNPVSYSEECTASIFRLAEKHSVAAFWLAEEPVSIFSFLLYSEVWALRFHGIHHNALPDYTGSHRRHSLVEYVTWKLKSTFILLMVQLSVVRIYCGSVPSNTLPRMRKEVVLT